VEVYGDAHGNGCARLELEVGFVDGANCHITGNGVPSSRNNKSNSVSRLPHTKIIEPMKRYGSTICSAALPPHSFFNDTFKVFRVRCAFCRLVGHELGFKFCADLVIRCGRLQMFLLRICVEEEIETLG
jgi:hypothetical protein